jgi:hypothetical protein
MAGNSSATADRHSKRFAAFWRLPGVAGLGLAIVSVPLILVLNQSGILVALVALCLYPLLDVPRILGRRSWWAGAFVSLIVWILVFGILTGVVDSVHRMGDNAMVFLLPFMLYPLALVVSGLVRLEGRINGRPRESGPRIAAIAVTIVCGLFVGVPVTMNMIPVLIENATGNTPSNTIYSSDGQVLAASPGEVSIRLNTAKTESFHLDTSTTFGFLGPGWKTPKAPAGPDWLKPGQRIGVDYVYRQRQAWAKGITIWIDRKGCAGDEKWNARTRDAGSSPDVQSISGTTWASAIGAEGAPGREVDTFEFLERNALAYRSSGGERHTDGEWRQSGSVVLIEVNDCYALYEGRIEGNTIRGEFSYEQGTRDSWIARRR